MPSVRGLVVRHATAPASVLREPNEPGMGRAWALGRSRLEEDFEHPGALRDAFNNLTLRRLDRMSAAVCILQILDGNDSDARVEISDSSG